jgi:hypothetical protein
MRSGWRISSKDEIGQDEYNSVKIVWRDLYKEWEVHGRVWNQQVFGLSSLN